MGFLSFLKDTANDAAELKAQKLENKHEEKLAKINAKYTSLGVAYSNGIQPTNAGDVINSVVGTVGSVVGGMVGRGGTVNPNPNPVGAITSGSGNSMLLIAAVAAAVLFLPKMMK